MMRYPLLLVAVFWAAYIWMCTAPDTEPDEVKPEYEITQLRIVVHWYDSDAEVTQAWQSMGGDGEVWGFSECEAQVEYDYGACEIWVPRPRYLEGDPYMETLGHEVLHGLMGRFHDED